MREDITLPRMKFSHIQARTRSTRQAVSNELSAKMVTRWIALWCLFRKGLTVMPGSHSTVTSPE